MPAKLDYPDATDVEPTTINDIDSIRAHGDYRRVLDDCLVSMGRSDLADADDEAATDLVERKTTVYDIRSVAEAEALAEAATYALNGGGNDGLTSRQEDAVARIKRRAEYLAVALTPEAHEADTDALDRGEGVATDGGTVTHDDDGVKVSSITVDASEGVRPPAKIVSMAENHAGIYHLTAREYTSSGRPRMSVRSSIGFSKTDIPAGWRFSHARPLGDGDVKVVLTTTHE
jgi:hypothetical protein